MSDDDEIYYADSERTSGLRIDYDYLSGRIYVSSDSGMRIALTSGLSKGNKEIQAIISKLDSLAKFYKDRI